MPPNISKSQLLNFLQCPRRFWLDQYHPEHEGDTSEMDAALDAEEAADATARTLHTGDRVHAISGRLGLRNAIEQTRHALEAGVILLDAVFEHEGLSVHIDVLDWSNDVPRAISITAASEVSPRHIQDCAIQRWVLNHLDHPRHNFFVGLSGNDPVANGNFDSRFKLADVTDQIASQAERVDLALSQARAQHAALDEPVTGTGPHCHDTGYRCQFLNYCDQR